MKKVLNILLLLFTCVPEVLVAQTNLNPSQAEDYQQVPQEKVFVHYNNSLLFAGEYIYYKLYTLYAATGEMSSLSKVAYVELLGEDGTRVFRHKIKLDNGTGRGDFFIPTAVPSGNYKLVGYTQWMLNGGEENIFRSDVAILNPYRGDQRAVTPKDDAENTISEGPVAEDVLQTQNASSDLQLILEKRIYAPRQQVSLRLIGSAEAAEGNYSVSVRKAENIAQPAMPAATDYSSLFRNSGRGDATAVYLPELRGELLWGRIVPANNSAGSPVKNKKVVLSIPGEDYVVKVAAANDRGEFFFNIDGNYSGATALLEVIGAGKEQYQIQLREKPAVDYRALDFDKFYISPEMEEMIVERSVFNQIENAYFSVKPDTLLPAQSRRPFYDMQPITYNLDDYTRFPTIRETFIEIIQEAYVRTESGEPVVHVRTPEFASASALPPLILIDGVVVQDHRTLLAIPAVEIQRIGVVRNNYYLGPQMFQGILDVTTIAGNFHERYAPEHLTSMELVKPQPQKAYFKQQYNNGNNENIPDFRYQLLWQPTVSFRGGQALLNFYTSNVKGEFEIHVEGFTKDGSPVSLREVIRVE